MLRMLANLIHLTLQSAPGPCPFIFYGNHPE